MVVTETENSAMIYLSAVQMYETSYIYTYILHLLHGYIMNSQSGQSPVDLIAQLGEHCAGIAEVMSSNPLNFFQAEISQLLKLCV